LEAFVVLGGRLGYRVFHGGSLQNRLQNRLQSRKRKVAKKYPESLFVTIQ
jgi:hypothetical protein